MKKINNKCRGYGFLLIIFIGLLITQFQAVCFAQQTKPETEAAIRVLIKKTFNKNTDIADDARNILWSLDSDSIPTFTNILEKPGELCERVEAAKILVGF